MEKGSKKGKIMKKYIMIGLLMSIANINQLKAIAVNPSSEPAVETMAAEESDIEIDKARARARGETLAEKPQGPTFKESEPTHETMSEQEWETQKEQQKGRTRATTVADPSTTVKKHKPAGRPRSHVTY